MRPQTNVILMAAFVCFAFSACTQRITDFTIISTKNVDLSKLPEYKRGEQRVKGEDKKRIIIIIPTGEPSAKEAVDKAIESVPGGMALLDGVLYRYGWYVPYIYGEFSFIVEGTPLIDGSVKK